MLVTPIDSLINKTNSFETALLCLRVFQVTLFKDNIGNNPLLLACQFGNLDLINWVKENIFTDIYHTNDYEENCLHLAVKESNELTISQKLEVLREISTWDKCQLSIHKDISQSIPFLEATQIEVINFLIDTHFKNSLDTLNEVYSLSK